MTADPDPDPTLTDDGLCLRDREVVAAVATGMSYSDAAMMLGCSESTVDRTMRRSEVRAAAHLLRAQRAAAVADALDQQTAAALATLVTGAEAEVVRLRAALGSSTSNARSGTSQI